MGARRGGTLRVRGTAAAAILAIALALVAAGGAMAIEEPRYDVTERDGPFEIRDYAATIVASTKVEGSSLSEASNRGFRILARYIFGANSAPGGSGGGPVEVRRSEKIAMTAPVGTTGGEGRWEITFAMPSGRTLTDLPQPDDRSVMLREVPARRVAVIRFSGTWWESNVRDRTLALEHWMAGRGLRATGEPVLARYDPPWKPWFLRRNEILVPLAPS